MTFMSTRVIYFGGDLISVSPHVCFILVLVSVSAASLLARSRIENINPGTTTTWHSFTSFHIDNL